jgi:glucosyl-3-phosphoglycerate synthase
MAFGILRAFFSRLRLHGIVPDLPELTSMLRQFQTRDDEHEQVLLEIHEEERPPMIDVPAYREKRGIMG